MLGKLRSPYDLLISSGPGFLRRLRDFPFPLSLSATLSFCGAYLGKLFRYGFREVKRRPPGVPSYEGSQNLPVYELEESPDQPQRCDGLVGIEPLSFTVSEPAEGFKQNRRKLF